jgi:hypothetical protein
VAVEKLKKEKTELKGATALFSCFKYKIKRLIQKKKSLMIKYLCSGDILYDLFYHK